LLTLTGLLLVVQAAFSDGQLFDFPPSLDDGVIAAAVDVGRHRPTGAEGRQPAHAT